ncbi:MAG TPA: sensor histidine kinase, partial [Phototrophicaceae bacterium]|nr:sensor histidine kinase [Phototrophicaceae bacterium]
PFWNRLRTRLVLNFVLLAVGSIIVVTGFTLAQVRNQTNGQVLKQLESVAQLKQSQISEWLRTSRTALSLVRVNLTRHTEIDALLSGETVSDADQNSINTSLVQDVGGQLDPDNLQRQILEGIFVYNPDGLIVAASERSILNRVVTLQPYFGPSLGNDYVQSPYYDVSTGNLTMVVTTPIISDSGVLIGVLAGRLNVDVLREVTAERSGLGDTGETYFVSIENNYLLTPSRFEGYELTQAYQSLGINEALAGNNGEGIYSNYQNPPASVLGVYRWVPELNAGLLAEISEAEAQGLFTQTSNAVIALTVIIGLVAAVIGLVSATSIARPIARLTAVATQISKGDFTERADIRSSNEIGVLATTFNQMTNRLVYNINELDNRLNEINETNDALRVATARAREAARVKGEFLANVSHELRTPLNAIIGFSDMLLMGMSGELNQKQRHKMERLKENGVRLLSLINNILDITRIEARRVEIVNKPFSPRTLADRLSAQMSVLAERSNLEFRTRIDTRMPDQLIGDEQRLEQIVVNLLSNAIKFTEKGSVTLDIDMEQDNTGWRIAVTDSGVGIPPHAMNLIFEEFRQADGGSSRVFKGSGLGLAITRNLVRLMNGEITVESELGKGSKFVVLLPIVQAETPGAVILEKIEA